MPSSCPTAVQLEGLLRGTLSPAESAALDEHLAQCAPCRHRLNTLAGDNESWLQAKQEPPADALESPPLRQAMNRLKGTELIPPSEKAGDRIGRYKLLQQIGEGGCGVVYMAEQEEPVRRRVALKIIKLGMDTKSVIARFEAERQALALMDHANIAKVFDAGVTGVPVAQASRPASSPGVPPGVGSGGETPPQPAGGDACAPLSAGRPYFVMELVRGMKITEYCDEAKLSTRARLDLFIQVCQAIQHAHQKGIIHRDIKPSNILVTVNDGVPIPKVIDFGIAKATSGQQLTDKTLFTAFEQFIGTPAYMSPEQAMMTSLDIDTRSDIYALGVLLYELLTGKTPFDARELLAIGLDEMRRTIREQEPPRPSTRLSTLPGQELSTTAQRRGVDSPKLVSELRGDLDWIVMKALEKDRARRYETANGLAADIQRHLNNEPVVACPPSRVYRLRKTIQRNKLAFSAAASVATALILGVLVSAWQAQRARAERDSAEAVLKFFREKILAAGRPEGEDGGLGKDVTLRKTIDAAESEIAKAFADRPLVEADVRETLGITYSALGETALAIKQAELVLALRRQHLGLEHPDTSKIMASLGRRYVRIGKFEQGLPLIEKALELRRSYWGPVHSNTLDNTRDLGAALLEANKPDQSVALLSETLTSTKARLGPGNLQTLLTMKELGHAYYVGRQWKRASSVLEEALQLSKAHLGPEHETTAGIMNSLSLVYMDSGKLDEAIPLIERAVEFFKARKGLEDRDTLVLMGNRAYALSLTGKVDRVVPLYEEVFKLFQAKFGSPHPDTLSAMEHLAEAYREAGKTNQTLALFAELLKLRTAALGPNHSKTLETAEGLAQAYRKADKLDQALPLFEETLERRKATQGPDHRDTLRLMNELAFAYHDADKHDHAVALLEETLKRRKAKPDDPDTLYAMDNLAHGYAVVGRLEQARALWEETLELATTEQGPDNPYTLRIMNHLAIAYGQTGKLDQALPLFEKTFKLRKATLGPGNPETQTSMHNLERAYRVAGKLDELAMMYREQLTQRTGDVLKVKFALGGLLLERSRSEGTNAARGREFEREGEQWVREYLTGVRSRYTNDPVKLSGKLYDVAELRYRRGGYAEAEPLYREIVGLRSSRRQADDKEVLEAKASLARLLSDWAWAERNAKAETRNPKSEIAERAHEAERLLRDVLPARLLYGTNSWHIGDLRSRLGGALVSVAVTDPALDAQGREAKFREAESLLLDGYARLQQTSIEEKYYRDALERIDRLYEAWNKPDNRSQWRHQRDAGRLAESALRLLQQEKFAEAEAPARDCLVIREKYLPDDWRTFNARSMLGGSLLGQKKYADAEPLLLAGYEGMKQRESAIPSQGKPRIRETLQRLVQLYEVTGRDVEATAWKQKLTEFEHPTTSDARAEAKAETK